MLLLYRKVKPLYIQKFYSDQPQATWRHFTYVEELIKSVDSSFKK